MGGQYDYVSCLFMILIALIDYHFELSAANVQSSYEHICNYNFKMCCLLNDDGTW